MLKKACVIQDAGGILALHDIGFNPTNANPCVYVDDEKTTFILICVDDILRTNYQDHWFALNDLDGVEYCLVIEIYRTMQG